MAEVGEGTAAVTLGIPGEPAAREDAFGKSPSGRRWVGEAGAVREHSLGSRREAGAAQRPAQQSGSEGRLPAAGGAAQGMAMAAEMTAVAAADSQCGISQRPHPHLPSLGLCEGKQVGRAEREWRRGTARKGGREGGEKAIEREAPGERGKADSGKREAERLLQEGEPERGEDIPSQGPGGERKDRDCSQASDLLKDVERGPEAVPGAGGQSGVGRGARGAGAGPPGWCNSRGENGLCPTFLMPGGRAARL